MLALSLSPFRLPGNNSMLLTMNLDRYLQRVDIAAVNSDKINRRVDMALIRMGLVS